MEITEILLILLAFWGISSFIFNMIFILFLEGYDLVSSNSRCACFWQGLWRLENLSKINTCGKIIIEILYTIFSLPFLIVYNLFMAITYIIEYIIIKPFCAIFKRRK